MVNEFNLIFHRYKLSIYGISVKALILLQSSLSSRKQYVAFSKGTLCLRLLKTGVHQGSVLGTLVFLIYINDFF